MLIKIDTHSRGEAMIVAGTISGILAVLVPRVVATRGLAIAVNKSLQDVFKEVDDIYNMHCNREKCGERNKRCKQVL